MVTKNHDSDAKPALPCDSLVATAVDLQIPESNAQGPIV